MEAIHFIQRIFIKLAFSSNVKELTKNDVTIHLKPINLNVDPMTTFQNELSSNDNRHERI